MAAVDDIVVDLDDVQEQGLKVPPSHLHNYKKLDYWCATKVSYDCKQCCQTYRLSTSGTVLKKHVLTKHSRPLGDVSKITDSFKPKIARKNFDDCLLNFIVQGHHSFRIVEEPAFKALLRHLQPNQRIIGRTSIMTLLTKDFDRAKAMVLRRLGGTSSDVGLTTDVWTSLTQVPFMAVTAHFAEDYVQKSILIAFKNLPYPHEGIDIARGLEEVALDFGINHKIGAINTDNASNNTTANDVWLSPGGILEVSKEQHTRCLAHIINLSAQAGLKKVENELKKLKKLVTFVRISPKQIECLETLARGLGGTFKKPLADVPTRWNSTFIMIERAIEMKMVYSSAFQLDTFSRFVITSDEWSALERIMLFLKPFYAATVWISGSHYPSIALQIPVFVQLVEVCTEVASRHLINEDHSEDSLRGLAVAALAKLNKYEQFIFNEKSVIATCLDPRFKLGFAKDEGVVKQLIRGELDKRYPDYQGASKAPHDSPSGDAFVESVFKRMKSSLLFDEFSDYFLSPQEPRNVEPLGWWKSNSARFPKLSKLACDFLPFPATSVPSESAFSKAGDLVNKKRNKFGKTSIEYSMLLESWNNFLA